MELREIAPDVFAWLVPDRGWGWSNAGCVATGPGLMVDTFMDAARTRQALRLLAERGRARPGQLVNTHHNIDHCWGNQLFQGRPILAHRHCAARMRDNLRPAAMQALVAAGEQAPVGVRWFARDAQGFDFSDVTPTLPNRLLDGDTALDLGESRAELLFVGPAHTAGDLIVHLPEQHIVFAGDVVFRQCTPVGWEGTFGSWMAALDRIASLEPEIIVPGHGPLCGPEGARELKAYFAYVYAEARRLHAEGKTEEQAARRIDPGPYAAWNQPERLVFNVARAYREFRGGALDEPVDFVPLLDRAVALRAHWAEAQARGASANEDA